MSEISMQQSTHQGQSESLAQEASRHMADFLAAVRGWRKRKTPPAVWMAFAAIVFAFVMGWAGGNVRGISDGAMVEAKMNPAVLAAAAEGRGVGRDYLDDYFFARAADRLVNMQVANESRTFTERLWDRSSILYWMGRIKSEDARRIAVLVAERRLKYLQPAAAETLRNLALAKREWLPANLAQNYENTARAYSSLLGRRVSAEQLVFDAELRNSLGIVRTQKN